MVNTSWVAENLLPDLFTQKLLCPDFDLYCSFVCSGQFCVRFCFSGCTGDLHFAILIERSLLSEHRSLWRRSDVKISDKQVSGLVWEAAGAWSKSGIQTQTKVTLPLCVPLFFWMVSAPEIPGSESDSCSGHCFSSKMMGHVSLWWCIPVPPRGMHETRGCTFSYHLSTKCHCLWDAWQKV